MSISRWHMNRIGLVDFWCYENEDFEFENGHMLLRGSNGSGKSVTMQSFIPLLLDGNKSSERLDSFGTRSRKMDTYLIDENSDREERIGYLYLEFKRADSDIYKTIGMGLRARKGKPLQSWYFVIEDNRRINIDFSLIENHYTLTEKQLKNIIGDQLITSQREYMKKVNQALFGFESLDDYGDAISLLLQLRSPKLSNSLSPQKINEILGRSLQPLSDEELRPMSEAIINMDALQDQLESLKQSLTAAKKLEQAYQTYNQAFLLEKWQKYTAESQKLSELEQLLSQKGAQKEEFVQKINDYNLRLKNNQIETEVKNNELLSLKNNDIEQWLLDIKKYQQDIQEFSQDLVKKNKIYEQKESNYLSSKHRIKQYQDNINSEEKDCQNTLNDMDFINENLLLSEHIALQDCFVNKQRNFEFSYTRQVLKNELEMIDNALKQWQDYENKKTMLDFYVEKQNEIQGEIEHTNLKIETAENEYHQKVEEYLEYFYQYNETNQILKLSKNDLDNLRECLIDYEMTQNYYNIKNIIDDCYQTILTTITNDKLSLTNQVNLLKEKTTDLINEKEKWLNAKDLEPDRSSQSVANREYLHEHDIEYIPLYKLLDFTEDMDEDGKNRIEELLVQMNILDALVIHHDNKQAVLQAPIGCHDHYLWTTKSLSDLKLICFNNDFDQKQLVDGLHALGIENTNYFQLEQRYFQSGVIEGNLSLNQKSVYIGYKRRLQMKQDMIDDLSKQIEENHILCNTLTTKIIEYQDQLNILKKEHDDFIDEKQLKDKLNEIERLQKIYQNLEIQLQDIIKKLNIEKEKINHIYQQLQQLANQMNLSMNLSAFNERRNDLQDYQINFEKFKDAYNRLLQNIELIDLEQDKFEQLTNDIDELNYEIELLNKKLETVENKKEVLQKQLDDAGYSDLVYKIAQVEKRLTELNQESQELKEAITSSNKDIEYLENSLQEAFSKKNEQIKITQIYQDILFEELNYRFVFGEKLSLKELNRELKLLSQQFGSRKNIVEYQNNLQIAYFEQTTYLSQYNVVQENIDLCHEVDDIANRLVLKAINQGKKIAFLDLLTVLQENIEMQEMLIMEEDRLIFEEILVNTIGKKIRERIQVSRRWVEKMQKYMNDMNTSSGLQLSLKWKSRKALDDQQLDTSQLVELLEKDYRILKEADRQKISNHFRSKIASARKMSLDENTTASFHQLMKDVMDYREWFDFTLYAKKPNENRKELTSHVFYAYSGGEKALSMYVPLFSAVAAKFESAREDAPTLIALDEAFAGVDENNIDNMFALITKFDFDYIMNSQSLWGDYPSCKALAIYELFRPNNAPFVTVVAYTWNGQSKRVKLT